MTSQKARHKSKGIAHSAMAGWAIRLLSILSSIALAVLLVVTFAGVIMRYVFGTPILGSNEIIQLASVALVMLAMPFAAQQGDHIRVDVFDGMIGQIGRFVGDILSRAIGVYLLGLLAVRAWAKLLDTAEYGDATNMLSIPLWPFYGLLAIGAVLYAIVLILQLIDVLLTRGSAIE